MTVLAFVCCLIMSLTLSDASVQDIIYNQLPGGFLPSPVKYFKQSGDQLAMESDPDSSSQPQLTQAPSSDHQARLGYPIYTGTSLNGGGYSATGTSGVYSPLKLDLGGLLLGTVVGLGAVLFIPKLLHAFSYSANNYGHYGRSEQEGVTSQLTELASRVDRALLEHNVSASECMQRAFCSWQTESPEGSTEGEGIVAAFTRNPLVSFLLEGSRLERAVEVGRGRTRGMDCATAFPRCPVTGDGVAAALSAISDSVQGQTTN